jgi:cytochrome c-type biogenesis protein CcmE
MSLAPPAPIPLPRSRRRWGLLLAVAAIAAVIAYLAFTSVGSALVYYLTPSELLGRGEGAVGETVRLGGLVKQGSVQGPATDLRFVLVDDRAEVPVHSSVAPTSSFREGIGAVVEGRLRADGVFEATQVIVKHDENYEAPPPGGVPSDRAYDPGEE